MLSKLWKARRASSSAPQPLEAAPAAVSDRLAQLASEVWSLAIDLAHQRFQAERDALDSARSEADQGRLDAIEAADAIGAELDSARQQISAQAQALQASEHQRSRLRAELDQLTSEHAAQAQAGHVVLAQLSELRLRCDHLAALLDSERARISQADQTRSAELAQLAAERDEARAQASSAREDASHLRGRLDAAQAQADALLRHMASSEALQAPPAPVVTSPAPAPAKAKAPARARR